MAAVCNDAATGEKMIAGYWKGSVYGTLAALLFMAGLWTGWRLASTSYQSDIIKQQQLVADQIEAAAKKSNVQAEELEKARADREIIYRTITKTVDRIVDRPVYRSDCIDDDGLRIANEALTGAPAAAGKPDAAVPKADTAGRQDGR